MEVKNDDIFINKLIKETYESLPEKDSSQSSSSLFDYFQKQKNKDTFSVLENEILSFLESHNVNVIDLFLNSSTSCFSFEINSLKFDLPVTMNCFEELESDSYLYINENNDVDILNPIFSVVEQNIIETVFFNVDEKYKMILLDEKNRGLLPMIEEIFNNKFENVA